MPAEIGADQSALGLSRTFALGRHRHAQTQRTLAPTEPSTRLQFEGLRGRHLVVSCHRRSEKSTSSRFTKPPKDSLGNFFLSEATFVLPNVLSADLVLTNAQTRCEIEIMYHRRGSYSSASSPSTWPPAVTRTAETGCSRERSVNRLRG